jgi:hypothetical protein
MALVLLPTVLVYCIPKYMTLDCTDSECTQPALPYERTYGRTYKENTEEDSHISFFARKSGVGIVAC